MPLVVDSAKQGLVLLPPSRRDTVRAMGRDAKAWLNGLVTCDVTPVQPGRAAYGLLLNKQGKVQTDVEVVSTQGGLLISVATGTGESILEALERYLIMEDVELSSASDLVWVRAVGARAAEFVSVKPSEQGSTDQSSTRHGFSGHELDWLGLGGVAWALSSAEAESWSDSLSRRGDVFVATEEQARFLKTACGFPEFGLDYGSDQNPHEAALDRRAVSWNKGCYLGQEVVCMQDMRGKVKRRLVILEFEPGPVPAPGAELYELASSVHSGGDSVGVVTSVVSDSGSMLGFARLRAPHFESGQPLHVAGASTARIVAPVARG